MRGTRTWLPLLVAGTLALAACGADDGDDGSPAGDGPGASDGDATGGGDPDDDSDGNDGDSGTPQDEPDDTAFVEQADLVIESWPDTPEPVPEQDPALGPVSDVADATPDATELTVHVGHGDCDAAWGGWVRESDEVVVLATWSVPDPEVEMCNEMLVVDPVEVELDEPLGDRELVDATTGEDPRA